MNINPALAIDVIEALMIEGKSYRAIALQLGVPLSTLHKFCSLDVNIPRVRLALDISATTYAEQALEALLNAPSTMPEINRARELASHFRWLAAKRSPKTFSDKQEIDFTSNVKTIKVRTPDATPPVEDSNNTENL